MPNWYYGNVIIKGDIKCFREWLKKNRDTDDGLCNFADTFVPLSSKEWDYSCACNEWGTKWDLSYIQIYEEESDTEFSFSFKSAWASPIYLWKQLEKRYGVEVTEYGYEEQQLEFFKYHNGRSICVDRDEEWFAKNYVFTPSEEATKDEQLYNEELLDNKCENWFDALDDWNNEVRDDDPEWRDVADSFEEHM